MKYPFLYPYLYQQCENTFGYDDLMKRLGGYKILLSILDVNCKNNEVTVFIENTLTEEYNELMDFLDGNGFIIEHIIDSNDNNIVHIMPMKRKDIK